MPQCAAASAVKDLTRQPLLPKRVRSKDGGVDAIRSDRERRILWMVSPSAQVAFATAWITFDTLFHAHLGRVIGG